MFTAKVSSHVSNSNVFEKLSVVDDLCLQLRTKEQTLVDIFDASLGVESTVEDDFLSLGGNSLKALEAAADIHIEALGVDDQFQTES